MKSKLCVAICLHDDVTFLPHVMKSIASIGPVFVFVSRWTWSGDSRDWQGSAELARALGAEVIFGDWKSETEQRVATLEELTRKGFTHAIIPDSDEVFEPRLLDAVRAVMIHGLADRVHVEIDTYWKSPEFLICPREQFKPLVAVNLKGVHHIALREYGGGRVLLLNESYGILHHLSYAGGDERIFRKINDWSHKDEVVDGWFQRVWQGWDQNPTMVELHPTHPAAYGFAERIHVPEILQGIEEPREPYLIDVPIPTVSIVIPVYGAAEELGICISHLESFQSLLHEVIVVDNASPDSALAVAESFSFITLIKNEENRGFAGACNQGIELCTGEFVLLLNSDAYLTELGLRAMIRSILASGSIAGVGPYSNNVGHLQLTGVTYTSLETMPLFVDTFASMGRDDIDVDMLVGFCLLLRKTVLREVGNLDESFGLGTFEDNDLCYRIRRAGYRLVLSGTGFCHHVGSRTIARAIPEPVAMLQQNHTVYVNKWKQDLELGFASTLSGLSNERIQFDPSRRPDVLAKQVRELAKKARVSLCMIVKNEERVLDECLSSIEPFFFEKIVVDTGSTDRTKEIAEQHGVRVVDFPWVDSFSAARNESLRHAKGDWIFWLDADDTLPFASGEALLKAAISAPKDVHGFVVPVQFVDDGANSGTRVDHVKLFRNLPGVQFSLRIHEQVLASLSEHGGSIARIDAVVNHSGYDTSEEGQQRKRERDYKLLLLDLEENPDHPFVLFNLGMTDHFTGKHESAIKWLNRSIQVSEGQESHLRKAYALKGLSLRETSGPIEAIRAFEAGIRAIGWDPELWFHLGVTHSAIGNIDQAIAAYQQALSQSASHFYSSADVSIQGHKTLYNLGILFLQKGDYASARDHLMRSLQQTPSFTPAAFALFDAALERSDHHTAREMLNAVESVEGRSENWEKMASKCFR